MTAPGTPTTRSRPNSAAPSDSAHGVTFVRALHGEWIKLSTLRSTWWSIGVVAAITIGVAMLIAQNLADPSINPIQAVVLPLQFTMLLAGILGAISVTGEYSTGMIRSTLTANPVRGRVLAAKAAMVAVLLFVSSLATFFGASLAVSLVIAARGQSIDWADPSASLGPIVAASVGMAVFALIGVSFGFILRSAAGAISATVGLLFVLPIVASFFSFAGDGAQWIVKALGYLPVAAAQSAIFPEGSALGGAGGYLTLAAWVAAGMLAAWAVLRTRDA